MLTEQTEMNRFALCWRADLKYEVSFLCRNKIQCLPDAPLILKRLKKLDFSHNYIKQIPEEFLSECNRLEILEAMNNQLGKLCYSTILAKMLFWCAMKE